MKIRVRKRQGFWKIFFAYHNGTDREYELYIEKYGSFKEAWLAASAIYKSLAW